MTKMLMEARSSLYTEPIANITGITCDFLFSIYINGNCTFSSDSRNKPNLKANFLDVTLNFG